MVGVVDVFEKPDFHFSHGGSLTGSFFILDIKAVSVDGVFGGKNYFNNKLTNVFVSDGDMIKEDRGGFKREIVVGDKMNNFLSKSPVFDGIWASEFHKWNLLTKTMLAG